MYLIILSNMFNNAVESMLGAYFGTGSAPTGTLKVALMNGYTFDETHAFWSDVSASEASGSGYTAGGQAIDNESVTQSDANDGAFFGFDNELFSTISVTANGYILYFDTGTPSTSQLVLYKAFTAGSQTINSGDITISLPALGALLGARA